MVSLLKIWAVQAIAVPQAGAYDCLACVTEAKYHRRCSQSLI